MDRWEGKTVLVTGGSAGLGRAIVREFGRRGAQVVCVARNPDRLKAISEEMAGEGLTIVTHPVDVTCPEQVEHVIDDTVARFGRLDVLVNNVGRSTRTDLASADLQVYRELMEVNFYSLVTCTRLGLPHLVKSRGLVINIGSLSAKTAWPFMAPYTTSKFAVAAYTHHLRIEGPREVHYMLVCPGPIRREDSGSRYDQESTDLPSNAARPGAGAKLRGIAPDILARRILRAAARKKPELIVPWSAKIYFAVSNFSPRMGDWIMKRMIK